MTCCLGAHSENFDLFDNIPEDIVDPWEKGAYLGPIDVSLETDYGIVARIETQDLVLYSVNWDQFDDYVQLFGDAATVEKYAKGTPLTSYDVELLMSTWIVRWQESDPFSAFAVYRKGQTEEFIGHVVLGHGGRFGQADLAYLFKPEFQNQNYCKQALTAVVYGYAPRLINDNFMVNVGEDCCEPSPLKIVHATARLDDVASLEALSGLGLKHGVIETLFGAPRLHFRLKTEDLLKNQVLKNDYSVDTTK